MTLVRQRRTLKAGNKLAQKRINEFRRFLYSDKFQKPDDYIRTWEVDAVLLSVSLMLAESEERCSE
jgi:hypothetical protein